MKEKHRKTQENGENVEKHGKTGRINEKHRKTGENVEKHGKTGETQKTRENWEN